LTTSHVYTSAGNNTIRIMAQESSTVSQIQEVGYAAVSVQPSSGPNYSLSASPSQASISPGGSTSVMINIIANGTAQPVGLHASYSIPGVSITFNPTSGTPIYSSTMTISSQTSTPQGSFAITIVGNSTSGVVRQTTFTLMIGPQSSGGPIIGVFSAHYGSANITDTSLVPGSKFYVQVNVTNAPGTGWNGYEFALYYDQRYINVTSYDLTTDTVFPNPFASVATFNSAGALRLSILNLGPVTVTTGMLVNITFTVVKAGGVSPLILAPGTTMPGQDAGAPQQVCPYCPPLAPNWSRLTAGSTLLDVGTTNGYFNNVGGNPGPVASFTYSPLNPIQGQTITFNATGSYDPDNSNSLNHGIAEYIWDFGTIAQHYNETTTLPIVTYVFAATGASGSALTGNFTVRLTVIDSDNGFEGMTVQRLTIVPAAPRPAHDVALVEVNPNLQTVVSGQTVYFYLEISNTGTMDSTVNATIYYGGKVAISPTNLLVPFGTTYFFSFPWTTTGVAAGNYTISATVFLAGDPTPADNSLTDGVLVILPPPVLTLTPTSGPAGTTVTLHGSGFPNLFPGQTTSEFLITFDNQFIGYSFGNSTFTFTFSVPIAQAGSHSIHAQELYSSFPDTQTTFTVTAPPGSLSVSVTTGTVYFPGDTVTIFVQTSLNGSPTTVTSIQATLIKPGNNNASLTLTFVTMGLYKATYTVPSTGPILGTYAIVVKAHQAGSGDAQSLTTFEVKLLWLASQGKNITAGIAITGLVGVAAVAWQKGYFRRKEREEGDKPSSDPFSTP